METDRRVIPAAAGALPGCRGYCTAARVASEIASDAALIASDTAQSPQTVTHPRSFSTL